MNVQGALVAAVLALSAGAAGAATITFNDADGVKQGNTYSSQGLLFDPISIVGSAQDVCPVVGSPDCGLLMNGNNQTELTTDPIGGTFDLLGFSFAFSEAGNLDSYLELISNGTVLATLTAVSSGVFVADATLFSGLSMLTFSTVGPGSVRIDNVSATTVAPVPVPAAGLLLVSALGGLAFMRRRRAV